VLDRPRTPEELNDNRLDAIFAKVASTGQGTITREQFAQAVQQIESSELKKFKRSVSRNELSRTGSRGAGALSRTGSRAVPLLFDTELTTSAPVATTLTEVGTAVDATAAPEATTLSAILPSRVATTMEVGISKIFMAGFGWQGASCLADMYGFAGDTAGFALITGAGDFAGVCIGHTAWMVGKSLYVKDNTIDMTAEFHTGILLGTAAFCSGTTWQPLVNLLHDTLHCGFQTSCLLTTIGCGTAFYVGLRLGRSVWSPLLYGVEANNYANLKADAALSLSVGAATGCFVGTDLSFGSDNWMGSTLGIEDSMSTVQGMAIAGSSTAIGFTAVQMIQNMAVKPGRSWVD